MCSFGSFIFNIFLSPFGESRESGQQVNYPPNKVVDLIGLCLRKVNKVCYTSAFPRAQIVSKFTTRRRRQDASKSNEETARDTKSVNFFFCRMTSVDDDSLSNSPTPFRENLHSGNLKSIHLQLPFSARDLGHNCVCWNIKRKIRHFMTLTHLSLVHKAKILDFFYGF